MSRKNLSLKNHKLTKNIRGYILDL
jgi:hypothetical protein